jgi:hypothetical protein
VVIQARTGAPPGETCAHEGNPGLNAKDAAIAAACRMKIRRLLVFISNKNPKFLDCCLIDFPAKKQLGKRLLNAHFHFIVVRCAAEHTNTL